jgi:hypothetical protein
MTTLWSSEESNTHNVQALFVLDGPASFASPACLALSQGVFGWRVASVIFLVCDTAVRWLLSAFKECSYGKISLATSIY